MTDPQQPPASPIPVIVPEENTRFDQLMAELEGVKKEKADIERREKEVTDGIKVEAMRRVPEGTTELIIRSRWASLPWKLSHREVWRLQSKALKAAMPALWMNWAQKSNQWRLDPMK